MLQKLPSEYFKDTNSDKIANTHNYGTLYDTIIEWILFHNKPPIKILEVGCSMFGIGSGHAFCRMPFVDKYVGIDSKIPDVSLPSKFVFIHGNAYSDEIFEQIDRYAPFDLVIDDGSHLCNDQVYFMKNYQKFCKPISVMVCEDVINNQIALMHRLNKLDNTIHAITVPCVYSPDFIDNIALVKWNRG